MIDWLIDWWLIGLTVDRSIDWLIDGWLVDWLIDWLIGRDLVEMFCALCMQVVRVTVDTLELPFSCLKFEKKFFKKSGKIIEEKELVFGWLINRLTVCLIGWLIDRLIDRSFAIYDNRHSQSIKQLVFIEIRCSHSCVFVLSEDDVWLGPNGPEVLTKACPSSMDEIRALRRGSATWIAALFYFVRLGHHCYETVFWRFL